MTTRRGRHAAVQDALVPNGRANSDSISPHGSEEAILDQLFAEPIVQMLMNRDGVDELATRLLLQQVAAARSVQPSTRDERDTNAVVRLPQQTARVLLKRIGASSVDKLISALSKLKKNLTRHQSGASADERL
jgi:hypothetical protein